MLALCLWPVVALAQQYTVGERVGKKLVKAQELMSDDQFSEAGEILDGLNTSRMSDYERALVYQFRGFVSGHTGDSSGAISNFEKSLEGGALPPASQLQLRFNLAQLYLSESNWKQAIASLEEWLRMAEEPNAVAYYTLAIAYYQDERKNQALSAGLKALAVAGAPKESWVSLVLALRLEREQYREALPLLEDLVLRFPKKSYWMQLSAVFAELGQDEKSLAVQQLAYAQGLLDRESELLRLARLYLFHDLPYRAAALMQRSIDEQQVSANAQNLELLGQSWMAAREFDRALDPMSRAALLAEDGDLWLRLGQIHMEREEWPEAGEALAKAIAKGDLDQPGHAQLLLGITAYNQGHFETARSAFREAARHEEQERSAAGWLLHVDREARRSS